MTTTHITMADCRIAAQEAFHLTKAEITARTKLKKIARARQVAMVLSRELAGETLENIGWFFDRDHTTVVHAERRIKDLRLRSGVVKARYALARRLAYIVADNRLHSQAS